MEEESSSATPTIIHPSQAKQKVSFVAQNVPAETSQPVRLRRGGRVKSRANRGRTQSKLDREESGDVVPRERVSADQSLGLRLTSTRPICR